MKLTRVWRPIESWEEVGFNMWGDCPGRKDALRRAICFTGNHRLYGRYMIRVTQEWPNSCINALTDYSLNRRAWIGHAACALALQCPEDVTRQAWGHLTDEQRILANAQADRAIQSWEVRYRESLGVRAHVEASLLFAGHPRGGAQSHFGNRSGAFMESRGRCAASK
jgi:hypothetical protein